MYLSLGKSGIVVAESSWGWNRPFSAYFVNSWTVRKRLPREGVNSYFRRIVPGFEGVSSALHTGPPCKGERRRSMGAKVEGTSGLLPSHQWTLWTGGIPLPCISGSSLLVCMSLYRWPRKVPLNIWPVLQNRSLLLLTTPLHMGPFTPYRFVLISRGSKIRVEKAEMAE